MKFSKYFMLAGAAALLAACSSEEPIVGPGADQPDLSDVETYAQFTISMVGDNGTRAVSYENGTEDEYKVKSGKILVFGLPTGTGNETVENRVKAEYIVTADFEMTPDAADETDELDAIGSKVKASFKKGTFSVSNYGHFYGVVILNASDSWLPKVGQTFKDWAENTSLNGELYDNNGYMVMTNAPKYAAGNPTVLVEIDTDKVKDKEEDVTDDAATFNVQRVAAKVTLANATDKGTKEFTVEDGAYKDGKATITGWKMDLTRKTAYPVQNVWGDNVKGFFAAGAKAWFHGGNPERCHWADSKFYTDQMTADECKANFNFIGNIPATDKLNAMTLGYEYIRPNTMAYNRMSKGQTTRMIIRANFLPKDVAAVTTFFKCAGSEVLYTEATLKEKVVELYKLVSGTTITTDKVTVTVGNSGWKTFTSVVAIDDANASANYSKVAALLGAVDYNKNNNEIAVYKDGVCYYPVYVRHFADEQEAAGVTVTKGSNLTIYNIDHTGRYGIQRNTWYDLKVTKVSGPGMPTVPEPRPTVPVDEEEDDGYRYLEVTCNILNWAMRSQNVEL